MSSLLERPSFVRPRYEQLQEVAVELPVVSSKPPRVASPPSQVRTLATDLLLLRTDSIDRSVVLRAAALRARLQQECLSSVEWSDKVQFVRDKSTYDRVVCLVEHDADVAVGIAVNVKVEKLTEPISVEPSPHTPPPVVTNDQYRFLQPALPTLITKLVGEHSNFGAVLIGYGHHSDEQGCPVWDDSPALLVHVHRKGWIS